LLAIDRSIVVDLLVTACPKCQIYWKFILNDKSELRPTGIDVDFSDLTRVMADNMGVGGD